jgi:rhodanese-related sulfurtransferase
MKKTTYLFITCLILALSVSCNNSQKTTTDTSTNVIEVLAPEAMHTILEKDSSAQLIDVRKKEEFAVSHLKDAQNICVTDSDFKDKVADLDKDKPVYVYCKKGGRSARAAKILKALGFTKIYDLQGGITNWEKQNMETKQ